MQRSMFPSRPTTARWTRALAAGLVSSLCGAVLAAPQALPQEIQVGSHDIIDYEFDWGRDGTYCPTCNFGAGNNRLTYVDASHNVWVANLDTTTGQFLPNNGKGALVDVNAATATEIGNGSEWMFSQQGSQIVYSRWSDNLPHKVGNLTLGLGHMSNGTWTGGAVSNSLQRALPIGSLTLTDSVPAVHYQNTASPTTNLYWRAVKPGAVENQIPISSSVAGMTRRWVVGTHNICITAPAAPDASGTSYMQVFLYDADTNAVEQLTTDPTDKIFGFMWPSAEYPGEYLFFAVVNSTTLNVYRKLPVAGGGKQWQVFRSFTGPAATPYLFSPEPFTYKGKSYIFFTMSSAYLKAPYKSTSLVALTGLDPGSFRQLTTANNYARVDPEYYILADGPHIFYNRWILATDTQPQYNQGVFQVNTGLGSSTP